tara:strand:- start:415 stop:672 length:258 start_codon:yes stop_codon:yes gene_type:complete
LPGRPVAKIFFLLGQSLWGQNTTPYHLLLVGLHVLANRLGADLELSLAGGLLFLLDVAHFRAVQWIAYLVYAVGLSLALMAIVLF